MKRCKVPGERSKVFKMIFLFISLHFTLSTSNCLFAATPGTSGAQFLNVPVFARSAALGEAYTGFADDAGVLDFNPAGIGNIYVNEIWLSHLSYFGDTSMQSLYAAVPYRDFVLGASGKYHNTPDKEIDIDGIERGSFNDTDMMIMPALAYKIKPDFSVGVGVKAISQKLKDKKTGSIAADIGVYYRFFLQKVAVGASIVNIGRDVRFSDESDPLPLAFRVGGSWEMVPRTILMLEIVQPNDGSLKQRLGCEYHVSEPLWLRVGWKVNNRKFSDYTGFTCGFGVRYNKIFIDYAFVPHSDLGITHYITTGIKFGKPLPLPKSRMQSLEGEREGQAAPGDGEAPSDSPADDAGNSDDY